MSSRVDSTTPSTTRPTWRATNSLRFVRPSSRKIRDRRAAIVADLHFGGRADPNHLCKDGPEMTMDAFVSAGSTGAFATALLALLNPGDGAVLFEPFYGYHRHLLQIFGFQPQYAGP